MQLSSFLFVQAIAVVSLVHGFRQHPLMPVLDAPLPTPNPHLFSVEFVEKHDTEQLISRFSHQLLPKYSLDVVQPKQLCDPNVEQHAGYLRVDDGDKNFFFWMFESRHNPSTDPVLLWLNGGPGCSSLLGLFMELGPCSVTPDGNDTVLNPYSWTDRANVIFLDQPANVGYSHGSSVQTTEDAAKDVYAFLQLFFHAYPQYANLPFHAFGESYGGHYIPAIGGEIRRRRGEQGMLDIQMESLGIGNGLVDPLIQYGHYATMACNSTYDPVLPERECDDMRKAYPTCANMINSCYRYPNRFTCVPAAVYCNSRIIGPFQRTGRNPYDVRRKCEGDTGLCYDILGAIETYLNRRDVMKQLGVEVDRYQSCNMNINQGFFQAGDWMRPYHRELPPLLAEGVRVLNYAGDADFICNWYGNKAWSLDLDWIGKQALNKAKDEPWKVGKRVAGEVRTAFGFTFLRVMEAGHMAPYDQPEASLDLIQRWMSGDAFGESE